MKNTVTYWNPLALSNSDQWEEIPGSDGNLWQITLALDEVSGDYTRLTKFKDGYHTGAYGAKAHDYHEEVFIVSGRLYDEAVELWLECGYYASRPPFEIHGPFLADGDVIVLEITHPNQR